MINLFKILITLTLVAIAIVFMAFAVQNNTNVTVHLGPNYSTEISLYLLVLLCIFIGFMSAILITRFEYIKSKLNVINLLRKLKKQDKNKSKYISE